MAAEGLLTQFGYSITPSSVQQVKAIIENTKGFDNVHRHLIALNDKLKSYEGFIGLSSSKEYFKIKNTTSDEDTRKLVEDMILQWSEKYKIKIEKVPNKQTYYVIGYEN